jgi:predicted RNA binding protein YcfA (HicA-like mRNA interferase family)
MQSSRYVVRRLVAEGWLLVRTKGDHHQFKHPARAGLVTVPHPKKDLPIGTLRSIYRQAGWKWE